MRFVGRKKGSDTKTRQSEAIACDVRKSVIIEKHALGMIIYGTRARTCVFEMLYAMRYDAMRCGTIQTGEIYTLYYMAVHQTQDKTAFRPEKHKRRKRIKCIENAVHRPKKKREKIATMRVCPKRLRQTINIPTRDWVSSIRVTHERCELYMRLFLLPLPGLRLLLLV